MKKAMLVATAIIGTTFALPVFAQNSFYQQQQLDYQRQQTYLMEQQVEMQRQQMQRQQDELRRQQMERSMQEYARIKSPAQNFWESFAESYNRSSRQY